MRDAPPASAGSVWPTRVPRIRPSGTFAGAVERTGLTPAGRHGERHGGLDLDRGDKPWPSNGELFPPLSVTRWRNPAARFHATFLSEQRTTKISSPPRGRTCFAAPPISRPLNIGAVVVRRRRRRRRVGAELQARDAHAGAARPHCRAVRNRSRYARWR